MGPKKGFQNNADKKGFMDKRKTLAAVQVFIGGSSYGLMATTYKLAYGAGFSWHQVVASQVWFGLSAFVAACIVSAGFGTKWSKLTRREIVQLIALGALSCATSILYCFAMTVLPVSVALTLLFQFTWIGLVIQMIATKSAPKITEAAAAGVIVVGTFFASGVYQTGLIGSYSLVGLACAFAAAITCALFVALSGRVKSRCSVFQRGVFISLGACVASISICPDYFSSGIIGGITPFGLVLGIFGIFLPVFFFSLGTPHLSEGVSTIMAASELPAGLVVSMLVLGDHVEAVQWVGVAVILAGVMLSQIRMPAKSDAIGEPLP
jgi:drug/metabolite transporter (DMT)-like permease